MLLTRIWGAFLAVLAVGCLAGMFLLSAANSGGFGESDRRAIRTLTAAGVAALGAEIQASPVQRVSALMFEPRLRAAMARENEDDLPDEALPLSQLLAELSEQMRVRTSTDMTIAVIGRTGELVAVNGIAEQHIGTLVASEAFKRVAPTEEALYSAVLGAEIYAVKMTEADEAGRRLVAADKLRIGAGSILRRALGSESQAGLVRDDKLVGAVIGDQPVADEIIALVSERFADVPDDGASKVFSVGKGLDARLGAVGRMPGPAGVGPSAVMLAVVSSNTAAAGQEDLAQALSHAVDKGLLGRVNWVVLAGLMLVCGGLAIYLPSLEAVGPLRRLKREFEALSQGAQHQIFHERYSGAPGDVANAASVAYDALRGAFLSELEIDDDLDEDVTGGRERPRTMRARRLTRAHKKLEEGSKPAAAPATSDALPGRRKRRTGSKPERAITPSRPEAALGTSGRAHPRPIAVPPEPDTGMPGLGRPGMPPASVPAAAEAFPASPDLEVASLLVPPDHAEPITAKAPAVQPVRPQAPPQPRPPLPSSVRPQIPSPAARPPAPPSAPLPAVPSQPVSALEPDETETTYREIFDEFVQVKEACGEPTANLTFDRFAAKLRKNERDLRKKRPGIKDVKFNVYVKDGKAALKAKVVK